MATLTDIIAKKTTEVMQGAWRAKFVSSPDSLDELAYIVIPDIDPNHKWGPCYWQSRDSSSLPAIGDLCIVLFDNRKLPWVVTWWPT